MVKCCKGEQASNYKDHFTKHYLSNDFIYKRCLKAKICHYIPTSSELANHLLGLFTNPAVAGGGSFAELHEMQNWAEAKLAGAGAWAWGPRLFDPPIRFRESFLI